MELIKTSIGYQTPEKLAREFVLNYVLSEPAEYLWLTETLQDDFDVEDESAWLAVDDAVRNEQQKIYDWYRNNG